MQTQRQHFNLLKAVTKQQAEDLPAFLSDLFNKDHLVNSGLMRANENLEFDINYIQQGICYTSFSVSVSGRNPKDYLFAHIVERFKNCDNDIYVIGGPGSGALKHGKTLLQPL